MIDFRSNKLKVFTAQENMQKEESVIFSCANFFLHKQKSFILNSFKVWF